MTRLLRRTWHVWSARFFVRLYYRTLDERWWSRGRDHILAARKLGGP